MGHAGTVCGMQVQYVACRYSMWHAGAVWGMQVQYGACRYSMWHAGTVCGMQVQYGACRYSMGHAGVYKSCNIVWTVMIRHHPHPIGTCSVGLEPFVSY